MFSHGWNPTWENKVHFVQTFQTYLCLGHGMAPGYTNICNIFVSGHRVPGSPYAIRKKIFWQLNPVQHVRLRVARKFSMPRGSPGYPICYAWIFPLLLLRMTRCLFYTSYCLDLQLCYCMETTPYWPNVCIRKYLVF